MFTFWHWCPDLFVLTTQAQTLESCSVLTRLWLQASAGCTGLVSPGHLAEDPTEPEMVKLVPDFAWCGFTFSFLVKTD